MSQHHPNNVKGILKWCDTCMRNTMHQVSGHKEGACMEPHATGLSVKQQKAREKREAEEKEPKLF